MDMQSALPWIGLALTLVGVVVAITNVWGVFVINRVLSRYDALERQVGTHANSLSEGNQKFKDYDRRFLENREDHEAIWEKIDKLA